MKMQQFAAVMAAVCTLSAVHPALAAPITGQAATAKECGACHLAFPAFLLPARSWTAILAHLDSHFGEVATLDPATTSAIEAYLTSHAAGAPGMDKHALRGLAASVTPMRITETPAWIRSHSGEVSPSEFASAKVKSKANCAACHDGAARGNFGED